MSTPCPACTAATDDGLLCRPCVHRLERDLGDVPALLAELDTTTSRQARIGTPGKAGPARERWAYNPDSAATADDLTNTLTTWVRDVGKIEPLGHERGARFAATFLLGHVPAIRRHAAVAELVDEIHDAVTRARRAVDRPADRVYLGTCMFEEAGVVCDAELYATPTASEVRCKVCGMTHEVGERRAWLLKRAEDVLATVREASSYLGEIGGIRVSQAAIRGYLHRGRIAYHSGRMIRLGDLIAVVLDDSERRSA